MPKCEQFVYTAGKIGDNEGYQIIAKSAGITNEIISNLSEYLYPLGVKVSEFNESRSLLILPKGKISYSIVKNIGIGYDGRRGTLYNHTFVIDKTEFEKLDFDSRIFDRYFRQDDTLRGELKPIQIENKPIPPNFDLLEKLGVRLLDALLYRIFRRSKIALVKPDELYLIQNLLAVLPPLMRLIPFSTLVVEPDRQYRYDLIQIPERTKSKLDKSFTVVNPTDSGSLAVRKHAHEEGIEDFVRIILDKDIRRLREFHRDFEKIPLHLSRVRRIRIEEIFNQTEYEILGKTKNFTKLKNQIKKLYYSKKFTGASSSVMVTITKKIRKIIKNEVSKKKFQKKTDYRKIDQIVEILRTLLDALYYLQEQNAKPVSPTMRNTISAEITKIENMLEEISPAETRQGPYVFNYAQFVGQLFANMVNTFVLSLWNMWKR